MADCYADHHNEIAADLDAAHQVAGDRQVIAVVQPSGYARVRTFGRQMGAVLAIGADCTIMLDVHGTDPIPGVSCALVGEAAIAAGGHVRYATGHHPADLVAAIARPGDVVVLLGTGDVSGLAMPILTRLRETAGQYV